jgi:putative tricarboxylic transport membrane protein
MGPLVLALILGPIAESNLRRALTLSQGDPSILVTRPISLLFLVLTLASFLWPLWNWWRGKTGEPDAGSAQVVESME